MGRMCFRGPRRLCASVLVAAIVALPGPALAADDPPGHTADRCRGREPTIVSDDAVVRGTPGDDVILGLARSQKIWSFEGDDLVCSPAPTIVRSGPGDDVVDERKLGGRTWGGPGDDVLDGFGRLAGGAGDDTITCPVGDAIGGAGDDHVRFAQSCLVHEGPGDDVDEAAFLHFVYQEPARVSYGRAPGPMTVDLSRGTARGWGHDTLIEVTDVHGSRFDDVLRADARYNVLKGRAGDDLLEGGGGGDRLVGGDGADTLRGGAGSDDLWGLDGRHFDRGDADNVLAGGAGHDLLTGGAGDDLLTGGPGRDLVEYIPPGARVDLSEHFSTGWGRDTLDGLEDIWAISGPDALTGDDGANAITSGESRETWTPAAVTTSSACGPLAAAR